METSLSAAGDVYLLSKSSMAIDFGGGPVSGWPIVASFSPTGTLRWSRGYQIPGASSATIDACGSLVVTSNDPANFDPGCTIDVPPYDPFLTPGYAPPFGIARFAP